MIIAPQKPFLIDLQLNVPADTATHYVRAVIKNSVSGAILDTIDLTDNGSRYFSKLWTTPADMTGSGLQISILKTVYDDSSYTTESLVYGTVLENYIVRELAGTRALLGGGQSGTRTIERVDYEKIRKMIEAAVKNIKPEKTVVRDSSKLVIAEMVKIKNALTKLISTPTIPQKTPTDELRELLREFSTNYKNGITEHFNQLQVDNLAWLREKMAISFTELRDVNPSKIFEILQMIEALLKKINAINLDRKEKTKLEDIQEDTEKAGYKFIPSHELVIKKLFGN